MILSFNYKHPKPTVSTFCRNSRYYKCHYVQMSLTKSLETSVHFNFLYGDYFFLSKMISKFSFECEEANDRPLLENNQLLDDSKDIGVTRKHSPRVTLPESGRLMYKATLTSLLNQDPNLSHDRHVIYLSDNCDLLKKKSLSISIKTRKKKKKCNLEWQYH